jgi:UDP-glucose 4-epimerase
MKNVLIIGASGFIGQRVCLRLLEAGHTVTAADIRPPTSPTPTEHRITHVSIDVTKVTNFREVIKDFNVIIYLASTLLPQASNERPLYDIQSNLIPLVLLLEELRQTPDKRLIFASSGGTVYGEMTESILTEESPTMPLCSYGIVKLSSEKYISMYRKLHQVDAIILRIANPFGFGQHPSRPQGAIGVFINRVKNALPITIWGDGSLMRDYLWVDDVAEAFCLACGYRREHYVFNISSGHGTSINDLLSMIRSCANFDFDVVYQPPRSFDVSSNILSNRLAELHLSWKPLVSLQHGIPRLWDGR